MKDKKHIGILTLVLAIIAIPLLLYPITFVLAWILSIVLLVWSILNLRKAKKTKKSIIIPFVSLVISALASMFGLLWIIKIAFIWSSFNNDVPLQIENKDTLAVDINYYQDNKVY